MLAKYSSAMQGSLYRSRPPKKPFVEEFVLDFDKYEKALIEKYGKPDESYQGLRRKPKKV